MEDSVQVMIAICFFIFGLSMLKNTNLWSEWFLDMREAYFRSSMSWGVINILLGSFIIGFHWVWEEINTIITIFGLLFLLEGTIFLMFPKFFVWTLNKFEKHMRKLIIFYGILFSILSWFLFWDSYANDSMVEFFCHKADWLCV